MRIQKRLLLCPAGGRAAGVAAGGSGVDPLRAPRVDELFDTELIRLARQVQ